jgi:hypothetical protein
MPAATRRVRSMGRLGGSGSILATIVRVWLEPDLVCLGEN